MNGSSEKVTAMKANFMNLHNEGYSIPEIANQYNLHYTTVYNYLEDIAKSNNCTRDSLLERIFIRKGENLYIHEETQKFNVSIGELTAQLDEISNMICQSVKIIENILTEEKHYDNR